MFCLSNKLCLITGSDGHLGRMMSNALAQLGANLILVNHPSIDCVKTIKQLEDQHGVSATAYACDLELKESREHLLSQLLRNHVKLDVLINNAAFVGDSNLKGWAASFEDQSVDTFSRALEVNLTAPFHLIQGLLPILTESPCPSIINIGSIYGALGPDWSIYEGTAMSNPAAYGASKAGLAQLTKWLATTLAPKIRVNMVSPGGIFRNQEKIFVERYSEKTPMKRMGCESDLAGAICYFASDLSSYCTGQILTIDGGWSAW
jgi:NAD(P)-dependent dehydrogenase (short-subunit alcohol dehydrogenase family)